MKVRKMMAKQSSSTPVLRALSSQAGTAKKQSVFVAGVSVKRRIDFFFQPPPFPAYRWHWIAVDFTKTHTSLHLEWFYEMLPLKHNPSLLQRFQCKRLDCVLTFPVQCILTNNFLVKAQKLPYVPKHHILLLWKPQLDVGEGDLQSQPTILFTLFIHISQDSHKLLGCQSGNMYQHTQTRIVRQVKSLPDGIKPKKSPIPEF